MLYERGLIVEDIRQYLLSVTAAALLCAIINGIVGKKGTYSTAIKLVTGLFMAVTVIAPWLQLEITDFTNYSESLLTEAEDIAASGELMAHKELAAIIKSQTETYILDKATALNLEVTVEVTMSNSDPPIPCAVSLQGAASPYAKQMLSQYIANDLGIPEESQLWT